MFGFQVAQAYSFVEDKHCGAPYNIVMKRAGYFFNRLGANNKTGLKNLYSVNIYKQVLQYLCMEKKIRSVSFIRFQNAHTFLQLLQ